MPAHPPPEPPPTLKSRLAWFVGLWVLGVAAVTLLSYAIRYMLR